MAAYAIIEDGVVTNIIEAESDIAERLGAIPAGKAERGDLHADGKFSKPEKSAEQLAREAEATKQAQAAADAKADAKLAALADMSPSQVRAWIAANVTNLSDAKDVLATLAIAVSILTRRI